MLKLELFILGVRGVMFKKIKRNFKKIWNREELRDKDFFNILLYKGNTLRHHFDEVVTLFIGHSQGQYGINPKYLNRNTFNCCAASLDIYCCYKFYSYWSDYLKNLKNVFIVVSFYSFHWDLAKGPESWRLSYLEALYGIKSPVDVDIDKKMLKRVVATQDLMKGYNGYTLNHYKMEIAVQKRVNAHLKQLTYEKNQELWLKKLHDVIKLNGQSLSLVILPLRSDYKKSLFDDFGMHIGELHKPLHDFASANNLSIYDCSNLSFPDDFFQDMDHLNDLGAQEFSSYLSKLINRGG